MAGSTTPRPPLLRRLVGAAAASAAALVGACLIAPPPASAQQSFLTFQQQLRPTKPANVPSLRQKQGGDAQMLVKANEIDYDYANHRVSAVGNVQTVGIALYTKFLFPVEVTSLLLLIAAVGAVYLAMRRIR